MQNGASERPPSVSCFLDRWKTIPTQKLWLNLPWQNARGGVQSGPRRYLALLVVTFRFVLVSVLAGDGLMLYPSTKLKFQKPENLLSLIQGPKIVCFRHRCCCFSLCVYHHLYSGCNNGKSRSSGSRSSMGICEERISCAMHMTSFSVFGTLLLHSGLGIV